MCEQAFDKFATEYRQLHTQNISASGEAPEYFAAYKMRDFSALVAELGADATGTYLDYGSGVGASIKSFQEHLPGARLVCADVSLKSLNLSRESHGDGQRYLHVTEDGLDLEPQSLDGAFACCVFHHIPADQHQAALQDLRRVLKPGALLMIYEHNPFNPWTVRAVNTCPLDENAALIRGGEMRRRCTLAGFRDTRLDDCVFFPGALRSLRFAEDGLRWLPLGAQYSVVGRA